MFIIKPRSILILVYLSVDAKLIDVNFPNDALHFGMHIVPLVEDIVVSEGPPPRRDSLHGCNLFL